MNYNAITDEELINIYKEEKKVESEALKELISRYTPVVNNKASKFFVMGSEKNDIVQEGMIGLLSAIKNYDNNKNNTSFKTFANLCIDRKLITLIKSANRQKQMPLNYSISLNKKLKEDVEENENELMEIIDSGYNPFDEFYAELLPQDKVSKVEDFINKKNNKKSNVAFVGDGINDAPVIARADVGIAMGAIGSDAAIEAADVVLMEDKPSKLAEAIKIAKRTIRIAMQNIVFAIAIKIIVLILAAFGYAPMWLAVFADVGVTVLAVLNSMRALK